MMRIFQKAFEIGGVLRSVQGWWAFIVAVLLPTSATIFGYLQQLNFLQLFCLFYVVFAASVAVVYFSLKILIKLKTHRSLWQPKYFKVLFTNVGYRMEPKSLVARTKIKFLKNIENAQLIARVYCCTGLKREPKVFVREIKEFSSVLKDGELDIILAIQAIAYPNWKPFNSTILESVNVAEDIPLIGSSKNVILLELKCGKFKQTERFFLDNYNYGTSDHSSGLYLLHEGDDIFCESKKVD